MRDYKHISDDELNELLHDEKFLNRVLKVLNKLDRFPSLQGPGTSERSVSGPLYSIGPSGIGGEYQREYRHENARRSKA